MYVLLDVSKRSCDLDPDWMNQLNVIFLVVTVSNSKINKLCFFRILIKIPHLTILKETDKNISQTKEPERKKNL